MAYKEFRWYENGRLIVKSKDVDRVRIYAVSQEYLDYITSKKQHNGYLDLYNSEITSLGKIEHVDGGVNLMSSKITSLGNLKSVNGDLYLFETKLKSLGKLESVNGDLILYGVDITSLDNLDHVSGKIKCIKDSVAYKLFMNSKFKDQVSDR